MSKLTILSDIHGAQGVHKRVMQWNDLTLQLGDCGFEYSYLRQWDPEKHKVLAGNHDNYSVIQKYPHFLGDYGMWKGLFYVRGAFSIDKDCRTPDVDWWENEELTIEQGVFALEEYERQKPEIVVSHDCPEQCAEKLLRGHQRRIPTRTGQLLGRMFEIHQPKMWIFGHWHIGKKFFLPGFATDFVALNVEDTYQIEVPNEETR
jgi:predicted phosphodiesterase